CRQDTPLRAETVGGVRRGKLDFLNANFEHVSGFRALDEDWPGEDVTARAFVFYLGINRLQLGLNVLRLHSSVGQRGGATGGHGLDFDSVAGLDAQDGLRVVPVIAPGDGGWGGFELVISGLRRRPGSQKDK